MYFVYILRSLKDGNLYIGCTSDIERRVEYHNGGKVRSTKSRRPFELIYKEEYADKYEAFETERYYKTAKGKKEVKLKLNISK